MRDLQVHPPALIVDASADAGYVPPLDDAARRGWTAADPSYAVLPATAPLFAYIHQHYHPIGQIGAPGLRYTVYARGH